MSLKIITIPCLKDNYAYIIHDESSKKTTLVDAPDANPIVSFLNTQDWKLDNILITHHHEDHIGGVVELKKKFGSVLFGARADSYRLPPLDVELENNDKFSASNLVFKCIEVPGHTIGHVAYFCLTEKILFSGDSLMTLGCGRLFEGTPQDMLTSLEEICRLPNETEIYSGHEYASQNGNFALTIEPNNKELIERVKKIEDNVNSRIPNVPVSLENEKQTNPFLRCNTPELVNLQQFSKKTKLEIFSLIRQMKDDF